MLQWNMGPASACHRGGMEPDQWHGNGKGLSPSCRCRGKQTCLALVGLDHHLLGFSSPPPSWLQLFVSASHNEKCPSMHACSVLWWKKNIFWSGKKHRGTALHVPLHNSCYPYKHSPTFSFLFSR